MGKEELDLCISVVGGNDPQVTVECLRSLVQSLTGELDVRIYFIDNAAPDGWFDAAGEISPLIEIRRNHRRKGFGENHNSVIASVKARYYLLLNDDTLVHKAACETLVRAADNLTNAGFFGPKLLNEDGSIQPSVHAFPSPLRPVEDVLFLNRLPFLKRWFKDYFDFDYSKSADVDFVSGAALLVRAQTIKEIGLLDEQFFMYSEETDWCMRGRQAGWATRFVPDAQVMHYGGRSSVNFRPERSVEFLRSHARLIRKHYGQGGLLTYRYANLVKHAPKSLAACLLGWSDEKRNAEFDIVLWSLGLLRRSGLRELALASETTISEGSRIT